MENITIGFSRPQKWKPFAWLIMTAYGIPYDHVYIKFHSNYYERDVIYQASSTMVNFMSPIVFQANNIIVKEFQLDISTENKKNMVKFAMDNAGIPYGIKQCLGLAIVKICEMFGKKILNPFKDGGKTYVCCELATYVLEQYDSISIPFDQDTINPKELYDYLVLITEKK